MADLKLPVTSPPAPLSEAAYAQYTIALRRYLVRRLRAPAEAADLSQEIFARFLRKKERPEVIRNPLAFLFGIAANVIREHLQARRGGFVEFNSELADEAASTGDPTAADAMAEQITLRDDLKNALALLPPNHLAAILLIKGEGLSLAEAAQRTGFTEGTLNVYLCEARWKLKRILQDYANKEDAP
jgi:RNA polymerase sigma-70 factor (ECF subfamily)